LLPGYRETHDFGIHVDGGYARLPSGGILLVEDVMSDHRITVTGVEPINYNLNLGRNITAFVDGVASTTATVEDRVTIQPTEGYIIPDTFNKQIQGDFIIDGSGYRIAGNVSFPSVLKITAGENITLNGGSETMFVCPNDGVSVSPTSGYSMPENYAGITGNLNGVKYSENKFYFSDDTALPSIYKVVFNGYKEIYAKFFVVSGDFCPIPTGSPLRYLYSFKEWQITPEYVLNDVLIDALWNPNIFKITFGKNLNYSINDTFYGNPGTYFVTAEDTLMIDAAAGYQLPSGYLPAEIFAERGNGYYATSDYDLKSIYFILYVDNLTNLSKRYFYYESQLHTIVNPKTQINPLFTFDLNGKGYDITNFEGWIYNDQLYANGTIVVKESMVFNSVWK
jgi:hypothetical protein